MSGTSGTQGLRAWLTAEVTTSPRHASVQRFYFGWLKLRANPLALETGLRKHQQLALDRDLQFPQQALHDFLAAAGQLQLACRQAGLQLRQRVMG